MRMGCEKNKESEQCDEESVVCFKLKFNEIH